MKDKGSYLALFHDKFGSQNNDECQKERTEGWLKFLTSCCFVSPSFLYIRIALSSVVVVFCCCCCENRLNIWLQLPHALMDINQSWVIDAAWELLFVDEVKGHISRSKVIWGQVVRSAKHVQLASFKKLKSNWNQTWFIDTIWGLCQICSFSQRSPRSNVIICLVVRWAQNVIFTSFEKFKNNWTKLDFCVIHKLRWQASLLIWGWWSIYYSDERHTHWFQIEGALKNFTIWIFWICLLLSLKKYISPKEFYRNHFFMTLQPV